MGSAPSNENSNVIQRRVASVPNIKESVKPPSSDNRSTKQKSKQTSSSTKETSQGGAKVIRGGNAAAIDINKDDDIVFETFYHKSGTNYTCMYTGGIRYYLDSYQNGEWREFPVKWYDEGTLDIDDVLGGGQESNNGESTSTSVKVDLQEHKSKDNREGVIKIPGKGVFQTYIFEHRRNIHSYYDPDEGTWIKLPLKWELKTDIAKRLVRSVQESCPQWKDECDLLASLRASNYNVEDCVNTFVVTEGAYGPHVASGFDGAFTREKSIIMQNESFESATVRLAQLESALEDKITTLSELEHENKQLRKHVKELEENLASAKVDISSNTAAMEAMRKDKPSPSKKSVAVPVPIPVGSDPVSKQKLKKFHDIVKELHKMQLMIASENKQFKQTFSEKLVDANKSFKKLRSCNTTTEAEIEEVRALYRREVIQRKMLYNQLQEARGNIRVFCRVRNDPSATSCVKFNNDEVTVVTDNGKKLFEFDQAFDEGVQQEAVFKEVEPIITSCADGYNVSIMAYGQTGSGKTYTMIGPMPKPFTNPGVNIRAIRELFKLCNARKETVEYTMHVSMIEIYNENISDLFSSDVKTVELRTKGNKVFLQDVTELPVTMEKDIIDVMEMGTANRKVASTKMNSASSRSHLILILTVLGKDKVSGTMSKGTLTLCDLAGSERVSKTEAVGPRLVEAAFINKSLTSLGQVFAALRDNQLHVPYRNSKLTHILMPSLGGDAKACLFVNISADKTNSQETLSTLLFGVNARQVALGQAKKNIVK